jgi:uncharacterized protein (DUF58 family)
VSAGNFKYLQPEDIRKLSNFEFAPKFIVEGYLAGRHMSRLRGLSTEFRDYRQYIQGDDISSIDWKVYARTDRHYVKTFEHETNTNCYIFLDSSASMNFGEKISKLEYASFFAAGLCYLVTKSGNLVSLTLYDDKIKNFFPPGSSSGHLQNLMVSLEKNKPGGETSLAEALKLSFPLFRKRGSLVIISDFLDDPTAIFTALSPYLHKGFKIYLFHVLAKEEIELKPDGLVEFVDMEVSSRLTIDANSIKDQYKKAVYDHINAIIELASRRSIDYVMTRTDTHYFKLFDKLVK